MTVGFACDIIAERNLDVIHTNEEFLIANTSKTNSVFCSDQVSQKNESKLADDTIIKKSQDLCSWILSGIDY